MRQHQIVSLISFFLFILLAVFSFENFFYAKNNRLDNQSQVYAQSLDWPQLQRDPQRTGYTAEAINPPFNAVKWRFNVNQDTAVKMASMVQPIVASGKVFLGDLKGRMVALNLTDGAQIWQFQAGRGIFHTAAYANNRVYFTSDDGYVYCLDAGNGSLVWKFKTGAGIWTAPLVADNLIFVTSRDRKIYAFEAGSGVLRWSYQTAGPILSSPSYSASRNSVLFGSDDMNVYSLNASTGALNWKSKVGGQSFRDYWPVISDKQSKVIVRTMPTIAFHQAAGETGTFFVLELGSGGIRSEFTNLVDYTSGCGGPGEAPVIDASGDSVYVTTDYQYMAPGTITKINLASGTISQKWPRNTSGYARLVGDEGRSLSLAGNKLLISMSQSLGGLDLGSASWFHIIHERHWPQDGYSYASDLGIGYGPGEGEPVIDVFKYSSESEGGHAAPPWGPAVVANGLIFWISDGSAVVVVEAN